MFVRANLPDNRFRHGNLRRALGALLPDLVQQLERGLALRGGGLGGGALEQLQPDVRVMHLAQQPLEGE